MQSPYAMHVRARWRDTCHSQICDDSLEREMERDWRTEERESVCARALHRYDLNDVTCRGKLQPTKLWHRPITGFAWNKSLFSPLQGFLFKRWLSETMHVEKWESSLDAGLSLPAESKHNHGCACTYHWGEDMFMSLGIWVLTRAAIISRFIDRKKSILMSDSSFQSCVSQFECQWQSCHS